MANGTMNKHPVKSKDFEYKPAPLTPDFESMMIFLTSISLDWKTSTQKHSQKIIASYTQYTQGQIRYLSRVTQNK